MKGSIRTEGGRLGGVAHRDCCNRCECGGGGVMGFRELCNS